MHKPRIFYFPTGFVLTDSADAAVVAWAERFIMLPLLDVVNKVALVFWHLSITVAIPYRMIHSRSRAFDGSRHVPNRLSLE
jgi:hypothetical protein